MSPTQEAPAGGVRNRELSGLLTPNTDFVRHKLAIIKRKELMAEAKSYLSRHEICITHKLTRVDDEMREYIEEAMLEFMEKGIIDLDISMSEFLDRITWWRYVARLIAEKYRITNPSGPELTFGTAGLCASWRRMQFKVKAPEWLRYTGKFPIDPEEFWNIAWSNHRKNVLPEMTEATKWFIFADIDNFTTKELVKEDKVSSQITSEDCYAIAMGMDYRDLENSEKFLPWIYTPAPDIDEKVFDEHMAFTFDFE
jgi:CRISPR/Cas system CMR-associated protein Cmr5 small subunit